MSLFYRPRRLLTALVGGVAVIGLPLAALAQTNSAAILQEMKNFREYGSVLYIAAHPDDEDTQLIAFFARGRHYRMGYLSVTRGDGGQNVLGPEFNAELGVIRTQELLAARHLDGGQQFFTRALDFGYSKDYRETLRIWDKQQVLADVVRVIREFRPDVVIAGFSTQQTPGQHGHHVASAILAGEAFKLAGNPKAFPEELAGVPPWQPTRLVQNQRFGGRGGGNSGSGPHVEISGNDPVLGISFGELANRSRAMHKSQGFGNFSGIGGGARTASFLSLDGQPATNDIMDGIDTTWNRVPGGADIATLADSVIADFNPQDVAASVPALLKLRALVAALPDKDSVVAEKSAQLDRILQSCLGLKVETTVAQAEVVPGETMQLHHMVTVHAAIPIRWVGITYPNEAGHHSSPAVDLTADKPNSSDSAQTLPASTPLSQPYWLREDATPGMFVVDDHSLIGRPENSPVFPVEWVFEVGGETLTIPDEPVQIKVGANGKSIRQRLDVITPVSLKFGSEVALFGPSKLAPVFVTIRASRASQSGTLHLETPEGWRVSPAAQPFSLDAVGAQASFTFTVTAPDHPTSAKIVANAEIGGMHYRNERVEISYPHIPRELLQPVATLKALSLDLATRGHLIGYLPGAGDSVADCLKQMGYDVKILNDADLTTNSLQQFDAVVVGVRAFNVRTNFAPHLQDLFGYVAGGGTVVAQYNRPDPRVTPLAPFDLHLSSDRVTDETATMTFLAPDNPVLNTPNKITSADFDGWVQERGIYFPNQWDDHFTPIFACNDPGEQPLKGSLLVAQYGKGYYVYTGLDFFRELPAAVPGAYRLFANLVSLGK